MRLVSFALLIGAALARQTPLVTRPRSDDLYPEHADHSRELLVRYPLIDTHVDLSATMRTIHRKPMDALPKLNVSHPGHFDLPRARQGGLAGAFFTANAPCPAAYGMDPGPDFLNPTATVQHVLESIDLLSNMADAYSSLLAVARTADDVRRNFASGKLSVLMGIEGAHTLSNSLSTLRMYAKLGVRYVTLTHVCHNVGHKAFASSNGGGAGTNGSTLPPVHPGNGLTGLGRELVREMNRLGVMVDLSHTSDQTVRDAISVSKAPVIWSHSGSRAVHNHARNIPDDLLCLIGDGPGKNRGIVLSVLFATFIDPNNATTARVVDHIEHIASIVGRKHVGLGSDFNGISRSVDGMEDVSKWPNMIQELLSRGWNDTEIGDIMGGNLLRVMEETEAVAEELRALGATASDAIYELRRDLPAHAWGGPDMAYLTPEVASIVVEQSRRLRDEL